MINLIKEEIKLLERYLKKIKKGYYKSFTARRNGKPTKIRFKLKPTDRFKEGKLEAYKELLETTQNTRKEKIMHRQEKMKIERERRKAIDYRLAEQRKQEKQK